MIRGSTRPRWCTGASGWPGPERPHRVNDAVKKVIEQTGVVKGWRRRAVDSAILADAVATQDTVTQLVSAIRRVGREVPGAAGQIAAVCTGHDYSRPGKPKTGWGDSAARDGLVSALVNDANALVASRPRAATGEDDGVLDGDPAGDAGRVGHGPCGCVDGSVARRWPGHGRRHRGAMAAEVPAARTHLVTTVELIHGGHVIP